METESEVLRLPTSVLKDSVNEFVGRIYSYLLLHYEVIFLLVLLVILVILFFKVRTNTMARRAKRMEAQTTNNWFSWEEFEIWKGEKKH